MFRRRHYLGWHRRGADIIPVQNTVREHRGRRFSPEGQLAQAIPGFKPREPQRQMAHAVAHAIDKAQPLVVEAGTGTGKTYAYLAPALRAKRR